MSQTMFKKTLLASALLMVSYTALAGFTIKVEEEGINNVVSPSNENQPSFQTTKQAQINKQDLSVNTTSDSYTQLSPRDNVLDVSGMVTEDYQVSGKGLNVPFSMAIEAIKPKHKKETKNTVWTVIYGSDVNTLAKNRLVSFEANNNWMMVLEETLRQAALKATINQDTRTILINLHPDGNFSAPSVNHANTTIQQNQDATNNPYKKYQGTSTAVPAANLNPITADVAAKELVLVAGQMYSDVVKDFLLKNGYEMKWNHSFDYVIKSDSRISFDATDNLESILKKLLMPLNLKPVLYSNGSMKPIYEIISY